VYVSSSPIAIKISPIIIMIKRVKYPSLLWYDTVSSWEMKTWQGLGLRLIYIKFGSARGDVSSIVYMHAKTRCTG
jgi:hypothetical protein